MKILFICADPGVPVFGRKGCSTHVRETVLTLLDQGHEVRLVCSNVEGDSGGRDRIPIIQVEPYRSRKLGFDLRHLLLDRRVHKAAEDAIAEWKPNAIYERYSLYSLTGTRLAHKWKLPHLIEINALMTKEQKDRIRMMPLAKIWEKRIFTAARHVVVVSEPLKQEIAAIRGTDAEISRMPMAVNLQRFSPSIDGGPVRREHGLGNKFVIGYVGTLTGWHGISLLYELAARMKGLGASDFAILVVGGDERRLAAHREKVQAEGLGDTLHFIGAVAHSEVPRYIRAMDAALIPDTTYWSSPAKLFEYQGCGIPVLAPRYPAIEAAMEHGEEGMIFAPRNVEEMAAHAFALYKDPEGRKRMGARAREKAAKFHSWEQLGQSVVEIFERQAGALKA